MIYWRLLQKIGQPDLINALVNPSGEALRIALPIETHAIILTTEPSSTVATAAREQKHGQESERNGWDAPDKTFSWSLPTGKSEQYETPGQVGTVGTQKSLHSAH